MNRYVIDIETINTTLQGIFELAVCPLDTGEGAQVFHFTPTGPLDPECWLTHRKEGPPAGAPLYNLDEVLFYVGGLGELWAYNWEFDGQWFPGRNGRCLLHAARVRWPELPSHKLAWIAKAVLGVDVLSHDAVADVYTARLLYRRLAQECDPADYCQKDIIWPSWPLKKHKGQPIPDVIAGDPSYVAWAAANVAGLRPTLRRYGYAC